MRRPVYWIVITLLLCVVLGCASAEGGHGGTSAPGPQEYSSGQSTESPAPGPDGPVQEAESFGISGTETGYPDDPGDLQGTSMADPGLEEAGSSTIAMGADSTGIAPGYQGDFSAGPGDSPSALTGGGPGDAGSGSDDNGFFSSSEDHGLFSSSGDSPGEGYQEGSGGASSPGPSFMGGEDPVLPDAGDQDGTPSPGRGNGGLLQNRGSGPEPETGILEGHGGESGQKLPPNAMARSGPGDGGSVVPGQLHGSLGILAASAGGAGVAWAGPEGSGEHSASGPSSRAHGPHRQQQGIPVQYPCGPAQTTPVIPDQPSKATDTREDTGQRARSKRARVYFPEEGPVQSPVSIPASSRIPLFPFTLLLFGGYRRVSKKNVLEHDSRSRVFTTISENPGIDVPELARLTGINENTMRYHLVKLVESGRVTYLVKPGVIRYFPNQGSYSPAEQVLIHYLWSDTPRAILLLLRSAPGLTRQQISDTLGITGPSVTRHMEHLIDDGIIENRSSGRSNHYYLAKEPREMFLPMLSRIHAATGDGESPVLLPPRGEGRMSEPPLVS